MLCFCDYRAVFSVNWDSNGRRQFDLDISDQNFDHDCFFKLPVLGSRHSQITHCGITRVLVWRSIEANFPGCICSSLLRDDAGRLLLSNG